MRSRPVLLVLAVLAIASLPACAGRGGGDGDLCQPHGVAEASCPFCHEELVAALGPCPEHGVAEALCFACHPALEPAFRAQGDWCAGHDRPESQCWLCNPELDPFRDVSAPMPAGAVVLEPGTENGTLPRSRRAPSVTCTKQSSRIRFASAEVAGDAGLEYAAAAERRLSKTIECTATLEYDGGRHARLAAQATSRVEELARDLGDPVRAGDVLAVLAAPEIAEAKAAFLAASVALDLAARNREREADLLARGISTERDALEAEAARSDAEIAVARAREELRRLGFTDGQIAGIARSSDTSPRLALLAPFAGLVVAREAAAGETVEAAGTVMTVADVSRMWARLDVAEPDIRDVRAGQRVTVELDALPGDVFGGTISWVATAVDPVTRTLAARAVLDNAAGALRANLFGRARIATRDAHLAVTVPQDAVQWEGCCNVVFVRRDDTLFEPRKVRLGTSTGTVYEVLEGLGAGDVVVTTGSFLLKTELMKGSIGAGCCEVAPGV